MKKNIGIITFHRSRNYGAVLQAYALQKFLNNQGFDAEIIDYKCNAIEDQLKIFDLNGKNIVYIIKQAIFRYGKKLSFKRFIKKYLVLSKQKNISKKNVERDCQKYDIIISGSDQVWNTVLTDNDLTYFLDCINSSIKKIAYAASAGDKPNIDSQTVKLIQDFDAISVREEILNEYLSNTISNPVQIACDPTLLLSPDEFNVIASERLYRKKYVFLFMISEQPELRSAAQKYANERNLKLINNKNSVEFFLHSSPSDFISWIKNSECVFTNSFHGTVFSIKYHKNFAVSMKNKKGEVNTRVYGLLNYLSLKECMIDFKINKDISPVQIDYNVIDKKISKLSLESKRWLKEVL